MVWGQRGGSCNPPGQREDVHEFSANDVDGWRRHFNLIPSTATEARGTMDAIHKQAIVRSLWSEAGCHHKKKAFDFR